MWLAVGVKSHWHGHRSIVFALTNLVAGERIPEDCEVLPGLAGHLDDLP
jgi:hypothetical protein